MSTIYVQGPQGEKGDQGIPGTIGSLFYVGNTDPVSTLSNGNHHLYLNKTSGDIFHYQIDTWIKVGNIRGKTSHYGVNGTTYSGGAVETSSSTDVDLISYNGGVIYSFESPNYTSNIGIGITWNFNYTGEGGIVSLKTYVDVGSSVNAATSTLSIPLSDNLSNFSAQDTLYLENVPPFTTIVFRPKWSTSSGTISIDPATFNHYSLLNEYSIV